MVLQMGFGYLSSEYEVSTVSPFALCSPDTFLQCDFFTQAEVWLMEQASFNI